VTFTSSVFDLDAWLERTGLALPLARGEDGLETLHRAQAYTIPFENFDILLGRGVSLEPGAIVEKLVGRRRGGYCFELNGLLLMALETFGFDARPLLARVHLSGTPSGRGHMLLLVQLGARSWIADVGFGGPGLRAPIPFELNHVTEQDGLRFRLVDAGAFGTMLQTQRSDDWQNLYSFDLAHVIPADMAYGNHFTSTHPDSFFTTARVAALPRRDGRIALLDRNLTLSTGSTDSKQVLPDDAGYLLALREHFGIDLDVPYAELRPLRDPDTL